MSDCSFAQCDFEYPLKWLQCCLGVTRLVKLLPVPCWCTYMITMHQVTVHVIQSHIHTVHVCLARTCHCTLGRMTRIFYVLLQYRRSGTDSKMSRHRKLILEKKMFRPLLSGLEPDVTFWSRVWRSTTELPPLPITAWTLTGMQNVQIQVMQILKVHSFSFCMCV